MTRPTGMYINEGVTVEGKIRNSLSFLNKVLFNNSSLLRYLTNYKELITKDYRASITKVNICAYVCSQINVYVGRVL